jgi:M6 family metalloprotease-like protein
MSRAPLLVSCTVVAVLAAGPMPLAGQGPSPRPARPRPELRGRDFRPDGAWRRRAERVRGTRAALLRAGRVDALNAAARVAAAQTAVAGTFNVPVLLVHPSNVPAPFPVANYQQTLFAAVPPNGKPYTVSTFYRQLSNGFLTLGGTVLDWYAAPQTNAYYEDGCNGIGVLNTCPHDGLRLGELFVGALTAADGAGTDWGQFDNDGPDGIPNSGDDDGYVDFVAFVHPDVDGACDTPHIWSHRFVLSAITATGLPYVTHTPAHNGGFIRVEDYIVQSGVGGSTACSAGQIMPVGTIAHETGHAFGLPDLYDTDGESAGIGFWGLMGAGNYASPDSPARMEAWSLSELGWIDVQPLAEGQTVIAPITQSHTAYLVPITTSLRQEYLLLENRQALQSDTALLNPAFGFGPGVLVWHIDTDQIDSHGITVDNRVNAGPIHGVELEQADGLGQLDRAAGGNFGDGGDPYPGRAGAHRFSAATHPPALDNTGGFVGYMLDRFVPSNSDGTGSVQVRLTTRPRSLVTTDSGDVSLSVASFSTFRFDDILVPGEPVSVTAPTPLVTGRRAWIFSRWSNGQPAKFTLVPSAGAPDTVIAAYDREFRILVQYFGTGTVESSLPGVLYTGAFRPDTTAVTLRAVPAAGAAFAGWSGDSATANPLLVLPGGKPYDLVATFSVSPAVVAMADAARALMGGPLLSPQVSFALDQAGNNDGVYNLGDLLAYLDRNHATLNPALVQQLLSQVKAAPAAATGKGREH